MHPLLVPLHATPGDQPPPLTLLRMLTAWTFEPVVAVGLVLAAGAYLWGVARLRRRGDRWPVSRTLCFVLGGLGTALFATMGSVATYDTVLFSMHMVQHMVLTMVTPVFLALGAPVTLLLRNLDAPWRKRLLRVLHSLPARILLFPPLATALMCASPFALYLSGWYEFTLRNGWAHDALHGFFLAMGCLFFWPLLGTDPLPNRLPYPVRMLMFLITMPFHSFLGSMIMGSERLIAEDWYTSFLRAWPPSPLADQAIAGAILWASGDFIMLLFIIALMVQWVGASQREARQVDRRLDREEALAHRRAERVDAEARRSAATEYDAQPDESTTDGEAR